MNLSPFPVPMAHWIFRISAFGAVVTVALVWWMLPDGALFPQRLQQPWNRDAVTSGFQATVILSAVLLGHAARRIRTAPVAELNVPHADFWLTSRESCARRRLEDDVWWLGTWTMWLLAWSASAVWHAERHGPNPMADVYPMEWTILAVMGSILALGTIVRRGFYGRFKRAALAETQGV